MHFLQAINSYLSVLIVCNKTGGTIKGDIKKKNWNKKDLPEEWKESIVVTTYKDNKTDCSIHRSLLFLSATYKILSNIMLTRLTPYAEEIPGFHQRGFRRNKSITESCSIPLSGRTGCCPAPDPRQPATKHCTPQAVITHIVSGS